MATLGFIVVLVVTVQMTNLKNNEKGPESLEFTFKGSLVTFFCFLSSFFVSWFAKKFFTKYYWLIIAISSFIYLMVLMIVNYTRELEIKKKHEEILRLYQALSDVLGNVDVANIDFSQVPFQYEIDSKTHEVNFIKLDTSMQGGKFNENSITLAQYSINKFFPESQWISKMDYPKRELIFKGLPKPPKVAMFPGSDYRPTSWIPLGLSGEGEIGWNMGDPKKSDMGISSFINEDGVSPGYVDLPSAPQCLVLGSTGGGKSIYVNQIVHIRKRIE